MWTAFAILLSAFCFGLTQVDRLPYLTKLVVIFAFAAGAYLVWGLIELPQFMEEHGPGRKPKPTVTQTQEWR
jgi:hypothetical protein